jgi:predicted nucleic acid-binding protein
VNTVVDTSVAAKWYFPEPGQSMAEELLWEGVEARRVLIAPDLLEAEFTNLLWKKVRIGECDEALAFEILALWEGDRPVLISASLLSGRALELACRLDHPAFDCLYLAAAIEYEAVLATADRRLQRIARPLVPEVLLVSD